MKAFKRSFNVITFTLVLFLLVFCDAAGAARIKDIASFKGVRSNQLVGYGLVVGLNGTGDGTGTRFTAQSLINMMERLGIHTTENIRVENVAAVMVTADLPPFARRGSRIDVLVSSIGDADSLQGGTLLMTPLRGADNNVYAIAQGPMVVGGFAAAGAAGGGAQKNHPTVGRISNGATIENEINFDFNDLNSLTIALNRPDFTTALRMSEAIQSSMGNVEVFPLDAGTVKVNIPETHRNNLVGLVAFLEQIEIRPDIEAKIILSERTGTVIMGENVRISPVAIAHGNLSVQIKERSLVSQPGPFSEGKTAVVPDSEVVIREDDNRLVLVQPEGASLGDLVNALNAIGVTPRDLITIFQAIKASGALQAQLEII